MQPHKPMHPKTGKPANLQTYKPINPQSHQFNWTEAAALAALIALIWFFWNSWLIFPLKILVVFFHELSHALTALATGGKVDHVEIVAAQGGVCWTSGGNRFLILTAGYLGSLIWGGIILLLAARTEWDRAATAFLGAVLLLAGLVWVRPLASFGFVSTTLTGVAVAASALFLPNTVNDLLLKIIGLTSVAYAILDIKQDILDRPHILESDAAQLARYTGLPTLFWGVVWIAFALIAAGALLAASCRRRVPGYRPRQRL